MVAQSRVTANILDAQLSTLQPKQLEKSTIRCWAIKRWKWVRLLKPYVVVGSILNDHLRKLSARWIPSLLRTDLSPESCDKYETVLGVIRSKLWRIFGLFHNRWRNMDWPKISQRPSHRRINWFFQVTPRQKLSRWRCQVFGMHAV